VPQPSDVTVAATRPTLGVRTLTDRFLAAVPLLSVFVWLCLVYAWQAWKHGSPWVFGDELELTQLSRAIAATGHAARRGEPHSFDTLYTYLTAPAWLIDDTHKAYATIRYLGVVLMTLTVFPAYALARTVVGRGPALLAAAAAAAIPALGYSSMIVEEPLAYPYATFCLFLVVRALLRPSRGWIAAAAAASVVAPLVRGELAMIPATFALAALFRVWQSDRGRRWRVGWSVGDWVGAAVLAVGAAIVTSAVIGHQSTLWFITTDVYKHRIWTLGLRAAGALTIGLGVLPLVAGLAALWRAPGERTTAALRTFRSVFLAAIATFGLYTAVKAAYLSVSFTTSTVERNLIYLAPLLLVGTAIWVERRAVHPIAVLAAGGLALYLVLTTPYGMDKDVFSDAPGLAILEQANRQLGWTPGVARAVLLVLLGISVAALLGVGWLRQPRIAAAVAAAVALVAAAWSFTGELAFADASNRSSRAFLANIREPATWLDARTHGQPVLYLGQQIADPNSENLLEFWNRSLRKVWSLDGTAPGPGPILTPDVRGTDGVLAQDPGVPYVVADPGIEPVGTRVGPAHLHRAGGALAPWTLYRIHRPFRLRASVTGLYPDGWSGPNDSAYTRYSTANGRTGTMRITVSRAEWGGPGKRARVTIAMGTVKTCADKQPCLARVTRVIHWRVGSHDRKTFRVPAPGPRFRVEVHVDPKFVPRELSPQTDSDPRHLGAVITYRFVESPRAGS
jgi:hypothetical protein